MLIVDQWSVVAKPVYSISCSNEKPSTILSEIVDEDGYRNEFEV